MSAKVLGYFLVIFGFIFGSKNTQKSCFFLELKNNKFLNNFFHDCWCFWDALSGGFSNPWIFKNERFV